MNHKAIRALYSSVVTIRNNEAFDADDNQVEINIAAVNAWVDPDAYKAKRIAEYPPIGDQLDALWKGGEAAAEMLAMVQAVKAKYPKAQ